MAGLTQLRYAVAYSYNGIRCCDDAGEQHTKVRCRRAATKQRDVSFLFFCGVIVANGSRPTPGHHCHLSG